MIPIHIPHEDLYDLPVEEREKIRADMSAAMERQRASRLQPQSIDSAVRPTVVRSTDRLLI